METSWGPWPDNTALKWAHEGPGKSLRFINTIHAHAWNNYKECWGIRTILNLSTKENTLNLTARGARGICLMSSEQRYAQTSDATFWIMDIKEAFPGPTYRGTELKCYQMSKWRRGENCCSQSV